MAERVGFGLRPHVENKGLTGFPLPPDPPEPLESRDGRTYCARGAIYEMYLAPFLKSLRPSPGTTFSKRRNQLPIRRSNPRPHPEQRVDWSLGDDFVNVKAFSSDKLCGNVADAQPAPAREVESTVFPSRGVLQDYEIVVGRQHQQLPCPRVPCGRPRLRGHALDLELRRDRPLAISGVSDAKEHPAGSVAEAVPWLWWLVMPAAKLSADGNRHQS